jgi:hypothetical protein
MKQNLNYYLLLVLYLVQLTGCGPISTWAKDCFYQGKEQPEPVKPYAYTRSIVAYDQFTRIAMFDALWLSDEVKKAYAQVLTHKQGKNKEQCQAFLRRQLEENRHFIIFLVLIPYDWTLGELQSKWSVFLNTDGVNYAPVEVKQTEIDAVYKAFFDKRFGPFKIVYRVKFDARNADDNRIITPDTQTVKLIFRSMAKEVSLCWNAQAKTPEGQADIMFNGPWDESVEEVVI